MLICIVYENSTPYICVAWSYHDPSCRNSTPHYHQNVPPPTLFSVQTAATRWPSRRRLRSTTLDRSCGSRRPSISLRVPSTSSIFPTTSRPASWSWALGPTMASRLTSTLAQAVGFSLLTFIAPPTRNNHKFWTDVLILVWCLLFGWNGFQRIPTQISQHQHQIYIIITNIYLILELLRGIKFKFYL